MLSLLLLLFCVAVAYLMGSLCSAVLVCRAANLPDPRLEGSKNPGATNVLRLAGKQYAALVLLGDLFKGVLPVWIASLFHLSLFSQSLVGLAAVIGHMYPMFFDFKGGKGVATTLGVLLGFQPVLGLLVIITWFVVAYFGRYSSLASIISVTLIPFYAILAFNTSAAFLPFTAMALLVLYQHKENIKRLLNDTEPKLNWGEKKQTKKKK